MLNINVKNVIVDDLIRRSEIINQPTNKEVVLLHVKEMKYEWLEYALFEESTTVQGRELIIPLPTANFNCLMRLKDLCDTLVSFAIGPNRDFEYVIRWSKARAVFHLLYSERMINYIRTPKIYTRDFWYDKDTNRQAKPYAQNAELRFEEGTFQREKDGSIKYEEPLFLDRDNFFLSEKWALDLNREIENLFTVFIEEQAKATVTPQSSEPVEETVEQSKTKVQPSLIKNQTKIQKNEKKLLEIKRATMEPKKRKVKKRGINFEIKEKLSGPLSSFSAAFKKLFLKMDIVFHIIGSSIKNAIRKTGLLEKISDFIN